jgi:drug/metabolite transporter (DMT)-like permease
LLVSLAVLTVAGLVRRSPLPRPVDLARIAAFGALWLGAYSVGLNAAERRVDAGTASMLINIGPLLIAVLAGFVLKEGFPRLLFAGCGVAFTGCVLIGIATSDGGKHGASGIVLLVVAAASYATAVIFQKQALVRATPLQVTWLGCAAGAIVCLPFAPVLARDLRSTNGGAIAWTLYLGFGPTALGFAMWTYALRRSRAGRLATLTYLIPVVATLLAWVLLGETPPSIAALGGALCLLGVYVARRPDRTPAVSSRQ